ncbi:MAG: hypothetical protein AAFN27_11760 [Pseudomonadota bacterium]
MSSDAGPVGVVLDKICAHNTDVLGCIVARDGAVYQNLPEMYELVDTADVVEQAENMLELTQGLETEHAPFDQVFLEYDHHAVYARRLDQGVLLLLNKPMERAQFKKMQLGVNLFLKPLNRALTGATASPKVPDEPQEGGAIRRTTRKRWF